MVVGFLKKPVSRAVKQAVFSEHYQDFHVGFARVSSLEEACKLIEVGFEFATDIDGKELLRKRR